MKRVLATLTLALAFLLAGSVRQQANAQVGVSVTYQTFYDELSPHGRWIDYPDYGYVWMPNMGPEFQPYSTGGHWVWTDEYEWMWVSDYDWGWAPFHYGRWFYDAGYGGWMWMPGYEWSPAWVAWRDGGDYYGWAPLRPGISISIGFGGYNPPSSYWCFAPRRYISSPRIYDYCVPRSRNVTIINNTTIINNYNRRSNVFISGGPGRRDAERYAGTIRPARFRDADRPGRAGFRNNQVSVYRPSVNRDNNRNFAPQRFDRYDRNDRTAGNNRGNTFDRPNRNNNDRNERANGNDRPGRSNVFDRPNRDVNNNNDRGNNNNDRPNRFERGNRNDNNNTPATPDRGNTPGRSVFDRGNNNNNNRPERTTPPRREQTDNNRPADRPNVFDRPNRGNRQENATPQRNNTFDRPQQQQPPRREIRTEQPRQPQQQSRPQFERREQPRMENRSGGGERRGNDGGGARRFGRG